MLNETLQWLNPLPGHRVVDMTLGLAGHGKEILKRLGPDGTYVGMEWDAETLALARENLADWPNAILINEDFAKLPEALARAGIDRVDGALLDAGVNLYQLTDPERSLAQDSELGMDMRMRRDRGVPASVLVNESSEEGLREILRATLEEREVRRFARAIVRAREREPLRTTRELTHVILGTLSPEVRRKGRQPAPALLAFRIAVNAELENLAQGIRLAAAALEPGTGRLVVLTFHSAEFRVARGTMRKLAGECDCPPRLPCVCGAKAAIKILTRKPPGPDDESLRLSGPQCRSCRLHAAEAV